MSYKYYLLFLVTFLLSCSATEEIYDDITSPDYVNSSRSKRLEVPPDLSELESESGYNVPGEAKSYKDYLAREKLLADGAPNTNAKKVIENPDGMKIIKSGNLRWLLVEEEPNLIWPHVKSFWEDLGFRIMVANKRTGIIETEWMDTDDIKLDQNKGALSTFDKWLDSLSGFADKRKFRTRVEYGEHGNTEIYISQRSAEAAADQHSKILEDRQSAYNPSTIYKIEKYKSEDSKGKEITVPEQREKDDYEIDSELLTRLMIKLGATDFSAREKVDNPEEILKAEYIEKNNDFFIKMYDPYERSWRRLGLAIDLIGFATEDKNRSEGIYFVRFNEMELPKEVEEKEDGIIDSLIFWDRGDDNKKHDDLKNAKTQNDSKSRKDQEYEEGGPLYSGIEAPEVKPIDEDYIPEEYAEDSDWEAGKDETWLTSIWPSWGDDNNVLPENEKRYRIRIKPDSQTTSIVYLDYPDGRKNSSNDAKEILKLISSYLK
jgi:outer membrane protein assembly factor BamC